MCVEEAFDQPHVIRSGTLTLFVHGHLSGHPLRYERVEARRPPAADDEVTIRAFAPATGRHESPGDTVVVRRALDWIRHRRHEHVGIGLFEVLDCRFEIGKLLDRKSVV